MGVSNRWQQEPGPRLEGSRALDNSKLQAPCVIRTPTGCFRLFYTAVGPAKPYPTCQGYILSAVSDDGLSFRVEPGIRLAPQRALPHMSLRVISPTVTRAADGLWRMYFESRGPADRPTVISSAVSSDMLHWKHEEGIRLASPGGLGGPRYLPLPDGRGRLYCCGSKFGPGGPMSGERLSKSVVSAVTSDGISFEFEPGDRMRDRQSEYDSAGISAAEVIPPQSAGDDWTMFFLHGRMCRRELSCRCIPAWTPPRRQADSARTSPPRRLPRTWRGTGLGSSWPTHPTDCYGTRSFARSTEQDTARRGWTPSMRRICRWSKLTEASIECTTDSIRVPLLDSQ